MRKRVQNAGHGVPGVEMWTVINGSLLAGSADVWRRMAKSLLANGSDAALWTAGHLARLHQLDAIFTIFGASDRDKRLILQGRGLRKPL